MGMVDENLGSTMKFAVFKMAELESLLLEVTYMFLGGKMGDQIHHQRRSGQVESRKSMDIVRLCYMFLGWCQTSPFLLIVQI